MLTLRSTSVTAGAIFLALLGLPAIAAAATPPSLQTPAAAADGFTEGGSMTFEWNGDLQGDPDSLDRAFFRVEVIKASDLPSGTQSAWPEVENFVQTEPGSSATSASLGVPTAGTWRWRVCAWGVVDDIVANEIQQLPGGCSASRSFVTAAATIATHTIGEMKMETRTTVDGGVRTVTVARPTTATPPPVAPTQHVTPPKQVVQIIKEAFFQPVTHHDLQSNGVAVSLGGGDVLNADSAASRKGLGGSIMSGLSSTLPLVPIPFWTLALLLACFPVARWWRRDVLGMFDWADGSANGSGDERGMLGDFAHVPLDRSFKDHSMTAEGDAPAPTASTSAPERGRHAA